MSDKDQKELDGEIKRIRRQEAVFDAFAKGKKIPEVKDKEQAKKEEAWKHSR